MQKSIIAGAAAIFVVVFAWAAITADSFSLSVFFSDPWVAVATTDLFLGFVLMAIVIGTVEGSFARAAPWIVAMFIVGNLIPAIYLILHFARLHAPFTAMKAEK